MVCNDGVTMVCNYGMMMVVTMVCAQKGFDYNILGADHQDRNKCLLSLQAATDKQTGRQTNKHVQTDRQTGRCNTL